MISVEKTAITNGQSNSVKLLVKENENNKLVLDYGCGKLRNTNYLLRNKFNVNIYDTKKQLENIDIETLKVANISLKDQYDLILCSFVLNVIPEKEIRIEILKNIEKTLKIDGFAYIEVRNNRFLKETKTAIPYNDGFLLGKGKIKTFQKPYTLNELKHFISMNSNMEILNKKELSNSLILKLKKIG